MSDTGSRFVPPPTWRGTSTDPLDEQFGDVVAATTLETTTHDAVLVGEPYDGAVIGRRGAAEAPPELRRELAGLKTRHLAATSSPSLSLGDLGDVVVPEGRPSDVQRGLVDLTDSVHALDALPIFLGGDNSLTVPNVSPLLDDSVGVVNLDAHLDVREIHDGPTSGTPYRQLHEAGLSGYVCLGARHFETTGTYVDDVREWGGEVLSAETVGESVTRAADRAFDALSEVDALYVSVDLDVLDITAGPGVSAPTPGGLSTRDLFALVRRLCADPRLRGVEVVECAPPLDDGGKTVAAAARAVAHALAGFASGAAGTDDGADAGISSGGDR